MGMMVGLGSLAAGLGGIDGDGGGGGGIRIKRDEVGGRGTVERGVLLLLLLCDLEATGGRRQERSDGVPVLQ